MSISSLRVLDLVMSMAGSAFANDGAKLIYDLTELGRHQAASISSEMVESHGAPQAGPGGRSPHAGSSEITVDWSAGNLELSRTRGRNHSRSGTTVHQSPTPDNGDEREPFNNATPTPEPGTLLLMGSGLAAGARLVRKRRNQTQ